MNRPSLINGSPFFIFRMLVRNGKVPFSKWHIVLLYFMKSFFMFPFSLWEHLILYRRISKTNIGKPPIFIIGHYRSGTTFLHKVMTADSQWSYLSTFDFLFPYLPGYLERPLKGMLNWAIHTFKIMHPHFNNYLVNLEDPLEEDMITISSLAPHSAFWGEVFPKNAMEHFNRNVFFRNSSEKDSWKQAYLYFLKKTTRRKKACLLLKNPPNTGRVKAILELFPDAKFIFIYRNPYQVFYSTLSLWKRTLEKHYSLHTLNDSERKNIIFRYYSKLMHQYELEKKHIPAGNLAEVRYETFENAPFSEVERIYRELDLPGFEIAASRIRAQLVKEKAYRKYKYSYDEALQDEIYKHWGYFIDKWNYARLK